MGKTNKLKDIENKLNEYGIKAFVSPDFKGNIYIMFNSQERAAVERFIQLCKDKGVRVLKNLSYIEREKLSGSIKLKVETLKGVQL